MKVLYLNRHAKSSWDFPALSDTERPLNERGKRDAPRMGEALREKGVRPDLILSSPANRALTTAHIIAGKLNYPEAAIEQHDGLYFSGRSGLLGVIRSVPDTVDRLIVFGHNPDFTDTAEYLSGEHIGNIPTCGVYAVRFDIRSWKGLDKGAGEKVFFLYPKMFFK